MYRNVRRNGGKPLDRVSRRALAAAIVVATCSSPMSAWAWDATVSWSKVPGATGYQIYVRHLSAPIVGDPASRTRPIQQIVRNYSSPPGQGRSTQVTRTVKDLPLGPAVLFSVRAFNADGEGAKSNERILTYETVAAAVDTDRDGLTDAEEDTDLDGLVDPSETDSLSPDSDGDGVNDAEEVLDFGSDPRSRDSDHDGIGDAIDGCNDIDGDGFGSRAMGGSCPLDNCPQIYNADQRDSDADDLGEVCDPCTNVGNLQNFYQNHRLVFRRIGEDDRFGNDMFEIEGDFRLPASVDFASLDPSDHGARVRVQAGDGDSVIDVMLPPGELDRNGEDRGWRLDQDNNTWRYIDRSATPHQGIEKLSFKDMSAQLPGTVRLRAAGDDGNYPVDLDTSPVFASIVLGNQLAARVGACAETSYARSDCQFTRDAETFVCE